jgi:ribose transport system permease protein
LVLWAALSFVSPYFLTGPNVTNILLAMAIVAALAIGQLPVIVTGAIDLSPAAVLPLCTVVGAKFAHGVTDNGILVVLVMLATGLASGVVTGLLVEYLRVASAFVVSLGILTIATGLAYVISDGQTLLGMPSLIDSIGSDDVAGVPVAALIVFAGALLAHLTASRVTWGRWIYAVGGNREAAKRVGIPVRRVAGSVFIFNGVAIGVAAVFTAGLTDAATPTIGFNTFLDAITAVVIGGASLMGGRGGVSGPLVGALILATIHNGLNLLNVDTNWEPIVLGVVLLLAVGLDQVRQRLETKLQLMEARQQNTAVAAASGAVA